MEIVAAVCIVIGLFFMVVAGVGVVRLPDVYTRAHAVALTDSVGAFFMLGGLAVLDGFSSSTFRILLVLVLLYLLNPIMAHATVRAALRSGQKPVGDDGR